MTSIAIVNQRAPYEGQAGQESVDLALAAASFGQSVSVFFMNDGVFQLLPQQNPSVLARKQYTKNFGAFEFYDIEHVYVCQRSLEKRGLSSNTFTIDVTIVDGPSLNQALKRHQHIVNLV